MKRHKIIYAFVFILLVLIGAAAGVALQKTYSTKTLAPGFLPAALGNLPLDSQFVFGVNVRKIVTSPLYLKSGKKRSESIRKELPAFVAQTGVDPERDIDYLVGAGGSGINAKGEGVMIVSGSFNTTAIINSIRSKAAPVEKVYGENLILMIPERQGEAGARGIVFLNQREIAVGDLEAVKKVLDIRKKGNKSILRNSAMVELIQSVHPEDMFWFAGDAAAVLANAPVNTPLGPNASSIRNIIGTFSITDAFTGKITATAVDANAAAKLAEVARGFVAFGQLSGSKNPELKILLSGLTVLQDSARVIISFNFPATIFQKMEETRAVRSIGH